MILADLTNNFHVADVLSAMSGGVDSSVATKLLIDEGFDVIGVTMKLFGNSLISYGQESRCCSLEDFDDAKKVCRKLGINHYVFNMKANFLDNVVERFCDSYISGETPNPCIDCNRHLKFGALQQRRRELGARYVATGHYARIGFDEAAGKYRLLRAADAAKDQSYVLYNLTQDDLAHMLFPLGDLTKPQVREIAREQGLINAEKSESQDICFIPDGDYATFIKEHRDLDDGAPSFREGDIVDATGKKLGVHRGLIHYTIGQRKGIGLASSKPLYVIKKDAMRNELVVGHSEELLTDEVRLRDVNVISGDYDERDYHADVKIGYRSNAASAKVTILADRTAIIHFDEAQVRMAPGQSAVAYIGDEVLCGGVATQA